MFRTTHYIAAACFVFGLTLLLNPPTAQARRPSTVTSKAYASGKYIQPNQDISLTTPDDGNTSDVNVASRPQLPTESRAVDRAPPDCGGPCLQAAARQPAACDEAVSQVCGAARRALKRRALHRNRDRKRPTRRAG